jgi:hypothetical protein
MLFNPLNPEDRELERTVEQHKERERNQGVT